MCRAALGLELLEVRANVFPSGRHQRRFTIMTLLLWTTVVASILAGGRWLATGFGWTPTNFFAWEYFRHLQMLAVMNATVAAARFRSRRRTIAPLSR